MPRFEILPTPLAGLKVIQRKRHEDSRGFFSRVFCAEELASAGFAEPVAQINQSLTRRCGSVRGMHFQRPPHAEIKLVNCLRGEVFDVAIDLRKASPTFLQWHAERLSAANGRSLLIPEGFAHGFQALCEDVELLYFHSAPYFQGAEGGLHPSDPALAIAWPLPFAELSERDAAQPFLGSTFDGV